MSWVGRPTAVRISSIVTRPALGILAAPTLANVAVRLNKEGKAILNMFFKDIRLERIQRFILMKVSI